MSAVPSWQPKVGSVAWRAIEHLRECTHGLELSTSALAEAIHSSPVELQRCLEPAQHFKAIFCRQKGGHVRSPTFWSLVDHGTTEGRASLQVLKAEPATADATDRDAPVNASPVGGPTGAEQPAAAGLAAGKKTPQEGANRDVSAGRSHDAGECASSACRAGDAGPACAVAPVFLPARFALWSDGTLQIERETVGGAAELVLLSRNQTRALVSYLDAICLDEVRESS